VQRGNPRLRFWQGHPNLTLVFTTAVFVGRFAPLIGLKEQHLRHTFIGVNLRWQRRRI
jgi:hypothetical protein